MKLIVATSFPIDSIVLFSTNEPTQAEWSRVEWSSKDYSTVGTQTHVQQQRTDEGGNGEQERWEQRIQSKSSFTHNLTLLQAQISDSRITTKTPTTPHVAQFYASFRALNGWLNSNGLRFKNAAAVVCDCMLSMRVM